jgi:uncharacterized membrane protein
MCAAVAVTSGSAAVVPAIFAGVIAAIATPFVGGFPLPDPPESTDFALGLLMALVGFCIFTLVLGASWLTLFRYLWKRCDVDAYVAGRVGWRGRDA